MPRAKRQHLKRRKDGRYVCFHLGHPCYGYTEDEAFEKREEYKRELEMEEAIRERPTVSQYAERWLKRTKVGVSDHTFAEASCLLEKFTRKIGGLYVTAVRPSDVKSVYSDAFDGLSDRYIRSGARIIRAMFDAAVDDGLIRRNPARAESAKPHRGSTQTKTRAITDQERVWIETLCTDHRAHPAVMAMLFAGLRPQEVKALNIDRDVDFVEGVIRVRESVHMDGANQYTRTEKLKTAYSRRKVPLFPPLREALKGKTGMLVASASGKPVTVQAWRSVWESYVTAMETAINGCPERWYGKKKEHEGKELPPFVHFAVLPYDLRHSYCTWCRDHGVEMNTTVHWMGHADAKMILQIYDEYSPERGKKEAERLEKMLFPVQSDVQTQTGDSENADK